MMHASEEHIILELRIGIVIPAKPDSAGVQARTHIDKAEC
jgi:hypothetical protein